ncbi:hypothetical protein GCM10009641_69930 [Mycobacterium cookii]|uniref:Uncharacterized protein n=1 Tax=Nocardioides furvisabuli TaxID=375542 RepID=A0ABP5IBK4_9ACTN|nr:hypothetical protein [Nocardioides furvisabuli]
MDMDALGNLLSGLIGAVVGALVGARAVGVVAARQITANEGLQRRDELRALIADFWGACDALWVAQQDLGWTILELQIHREAGNGQGNQDQWDRRGDAFRDIAAALKDCRRSMALIRLLHPELTPSAHELMVASRDFHPRQNDPNPGAAFEDARATALRSFEEAAKTHLASKL